jgi:hypothetical protein
MKGIKVHLANANVKKAGVALLTLDQAYFRIRIIVRVKWAWHNNKGIKILRKLNDPKHVHLTAEHQNT